MAGGRGVEGRGKQMVTGAMVAGAMLVPEPPLLGSPFFGDVRYARFWGEVRCALIKL